MTSKSKETRNAKQDHSCQDNPNDDDLGNNSLDTSTPESSQTIAQDMMALQTRNARVEADKAWETSRTRRLCIGMLTYIIAAYYLYIIGVEPFALHALVPSGGYLLSTLYLPTLKNYWIKKHYK